MNAHQFWQQLAGVGGTIYFGLIFIAAVAFALRPSKKAEYDEAAQSPLRED